jgi:hypothetical protein
MRPKSPHSPEHDQQSIIPPFEYRKLITGRFEAKLHWIFPVSADSGKLSFRTITHFIAICAILKLVHLRRGPHDADGGCMRPSIRFLRAIPVTGDR